MRPNFARAAHPHIIFHVTRLPRQHVHRHVDIHAFEVIAARAGGETELARRADL